MTDESGSKMFTHPDGTEFTSAKGLMDYVDTLKKEQEQEAAFAKMGKDARFNELVHNMDKDDLRRTKWHGIHDRNNVL